MIETKEMYNIPLEEYFEELFSALENIAPSFKIIEQFKNGLLNVEIYTPTKYTALIGRREYIWFILDSVNYGDFQKEMKQYTFGTNLTRNDPKSKKQERDLKLFFKYAKENAPEIKNNLFWAEPNDLLKNLLDYGIQVSEPEY